MNDLMTVPDKAHTHEANANRRVRLSEAELRDLVLNTSVELMRGIAYSGGTFRQYDRGVWEAVHELEVRRIVGSKLQVLSKFYDIWLTRQLEVNVTDLIKSKMYVRKDEWNPYPEIIVFKNCALDTRSMERIDHSPDHRATVALPYSHDPEATAPTWERVLADVLSDDEQRFFQEYAGYCLTTSVQHQVALWLYGPPGSAKSTLIAGLEAMLGDLAGALSLSQLTSRFGLAGIEGKTLLTCTEIPKQHMKATEVLNALITGDTIPVEKNN
jgi:phage/plasmid-associated DNA primase